MECFPPKIRNKLRISAFTSIFNITLQVLASAVGEGKKKDIQAGEGNKLLAGNMIICVENPMESIPHPKKLLELINEFIKVAGYKVNIKKSIVLIYTSNKPLEI